MSLPFEELNSMIQTVPLEFVYQARCPTCDTILKWFDPESIAGARILMALCGKCGIYYQIRIEKEWLSCDPYDRCNNCACCCIEPERWRKFV